MKKSIPVVCLTDFGGFPSRDGSVGGGIEGTIARINPETRVMHLTHWVDSVEEAAFGLLQGYLDFPQRAVFLCVVDPGVGTARKMLAVRCGKRFFVAPDNGLLWPTLETIRPSEVVSLDGETVREIARKYVGSRDKRFIMPASKVFHGRDYFAPAAALISMGYPIDELGERITLGSLQKLNFKLKQRRESLEGKVAAIDKWGSIITTITKGDFNRFAEGFPWYISFPGNRYRPISRIVNKFADGEEGVINVHAGGDFLHPRLDKGAFLVIFINGGSALEALGGGDVVKIGTQVFLKRR